MRLELRDIWAAPAGVPEPAVRGVSLQVCGGEWVAVGGANGSGKTTLLMVAAGLLEPRRGTRSLEAAGAPGADSRAGPPGAAPDPVRVATILQDPSVQLFAPTVAEEITLTALHLGMPAARREAQLRRWSGILGLDGDLGSPPHALSAGRQQLVLLAAALASEPDLLVADEPGAHLDEATRQRLVEALHQERSRGLGILWATQDPGEWAAASRTLTLGDGLAPGAPPVTETPGFGTDPVGPGPGEALLQIEVRAGGERSGPRVRTPVPFRLELPRAGVVCFEGPNGVGKSVLLAAACGLVETPQVVVRRLREDGAPPLLVGQYPERQIFEDTVGRELVFAAVSRGLDRGEALERAVALLAFLGLDRRLTPERHTWELSTGERRLVLLVGALIAPARLLALDEPTAGLDPERRAGLAGFVAERGRTGLILVASQDRGWVRNLPGRRVALPPPQPPSSPSEKTD